MKIRLDFIMKTAIIIVDRGKTLSRIPAMPYKVTNLAPYFLTSAGTGVDYAKVFSAPFRFSMRKEIHE